MRLAQTFFFLCLSFITGIALAAFFNLPSFIAWEFFILGLFYCFIFLFFSGWSKNILTLGLCLLSLSSAIFYYQDRVAGFEQQKINDYLETAEPLDILLMVSQEPDVRSNHVNLTCDLKEISFEGETISVSGRLLVVSYRYPVYRYGDFLKISGVVQPATNFGDFNYRDYLRKEGISGIVYYPEISLVDNQSLTNWQKFYSRLLGFKEQLREKVNQYIAPPESYILGAVFLGDKQGIPDRWKEKLNKSGLRHITAISGMHIVILSTVLVTLFLSLGFWRGQAFYLTGLVIALYVLMIGLPASAIRAGLMVFFFLLAQKTGRLSASYRAVVFAALLMLIYNPFLLKDDVGFQLSFLAVMGIISFLPFFENKIKTFFKGKATTLTSLIALTISAQVFTLPLLIYSFGYCSLVSPITNILVVPFLVYLIILTALFLLAAFLHPILGLIFSWPIWLLLHYIVLIVSFFSALPLASLNLSITWFGLAIVYSFLLFILWKIRKNTN